MLLAIGTGFRAQTLSLIKTDGITNTQRGVEIRISDFIKTSRPGAAQLFAFLPFFTDRPNICIAKTTSFYIDYTKKLRNNEQTLFLILKKPYSAASTQTISRWLKSVLKTCNVDKQFTGHSTRYSSTSKAFKKGLNINIIKNAAGWSNESKVFMKFYNRPILNIEDNFALNVCNN